MSDGNRRAEILTGLFVVIAVLILLGATLWITGAQVFGEKRLSYEVLMKSAGGVRSGDQVRVAGVEVGRVREIHLRPGEDWPVRFRVVLDAGVPITRRSRARFASDGLLGTGYLEIDLGSPPEGQTAEPLPPGEPILGSDVAGMAKAMEQLDEITGRAVILLDETTAMVRDLRGRVTPLLDRAGNLLSEENLADLSASLASMRRALETTETHLPGLLERLDTLGRNLEEGTAELPALADEAQGMITDLRQALGPDGQRLADALDSARIALDSAGGAFSNVEGKAADLEFIIRDLRQASANLRSFSQTIKDRPASVLLTQRKPNRKPGDGVEK